MKFEKGDMVSPAKRYVGNGNVVIIRHISLDEKYYQIELTNYESKTLKGFLNKNGINNCWELNRMATKLNTQVIGGFSKLVKFAMKNHNIQEMNSYVFKAWFDGKGYEKVGFVFDKECSPTYWFIINGRKANRMNYQKNKIKRKVEIGELKYFNESETEFENMAKNGINWIWDCGKIRLKIKK